MGWIIKKKKFFFFMNHNEISLEFWKTSLIRSIPEHSNFSKGSSLLQQCLMKPFSGLVSLEVLVNVFMSHRWNLNHFLQELARLHVRSQIVLLVHIGIHFNAKNLNNAPYDDDFCTSFTQIFFMFVNTRNILII